MDLDEFMRITKIVVQERDGEEIRDRSGEMAWWSIMHDPEKNAYTISLMLKERIERE